MIMAAPLKLDFSYIVKLEDEEKIVKQNGGLLESSPRADADG
jgi:hypothetical protein